LAHRATKSYDEDGNAVYRIVVPAEEGAVIDAAVEAMRDRLERRTADASAQASSPQQQELPALKLVPYASAEASSPQHATLGDAFVEMARTALDA
jgi:hypothetical protein